jgi:hypothetical protein
MSKRFTGSSHLWLTTGIDNSAGTSGNDTAIAVIGTGATLNPGDSLAMGLGTDTLRISYGSDVAVSTALAAATVTGVDTVSLINPGVGDNSVNLTGLAGLKTLVIENAALLNSTTTATSIQTPVGGVNLSLATAGGATTAGPVIWAANAADTTLNLTLNGYVGTGTATNLTTTGAAATTLNVTTATAANKAATFLAPVTVTTLNIAAGTALTNTATTSVAATTVNITGAGNVALGTTNFAATVTIDASAATGNVSATTEATTTLTYRGGSGNDTVVFAAGELTSADVIDMGSGSGDVLSIADTALGGSTTTALNTVVNAINGVDVLLSTGAATIDMSGVTVSTLRLGATANQVVQKLAATDKIQVNGVTAGTLDATASLGFNTLNLEMNGGAAVAALGATNVTSQATINILSTTSETTSAGANTIAAITNSANASFVVTGANALTVTSLSAAASFDASAATGAIIVTGANGASILKGGNKADTLTGATLAGGDTFDGGAGNDTINTGAQTGTVATVITGGLGADAINLQGVGAHAKVYTINATAAQSFATAGQFDTVTISDGAAQAAANTITLVTGLLSSVLVGATSVTIGTTTITAGGFLAVGSASATLTTTDQNFQIYQDSNSNGIIDATDLRVDFTDAATDTTAITLVGSQIVVVHTGV